jgi:lysine 2,3-aminomutase
MGNQTQVSCATSAKRHVTTSDSLKGQSVGDDADPLPRRTSEAAEPPVAPAEPGWQRVRRNRSLSSAEAFRKQWFPAVSAAEWSDWRWQLRNKLCTYDQLSRFIQLSPEETDALCHPTMALPVAVTPYYASLIDSFDSSQAIRRTVIPVGRERLVAAEESEDPLDESTQSPVPGLVHRYPDRVLFLATSYCSTYCRYCTRSRLVGHACDGQTASKDRWQLALTYIEDHPEVRDVLISGGDPLTLPDGQLAWLLCRLRAIKHVEIIRIGTKVPAVLPQRVTPALTLMLKRFHPLWISIHATHPDEVTSEMAMACERLADAGIPLGSQTVLLAGVNDDADVLRSLYHKLMMIRVRPYYLYQCDPIVGSAHFRTPVEKGVQIIRKLRGHTSGYAVPSFVIDAPGGGGKIPVTPDYVVAREDGKVVLRNYEDKTFVYPDPTIA